MARGEFYALLDADDVSRPERIERQAAVLATNPHVAGVFCGHELILNGRVLAPLFRAKSAEECEKIIRAGQMPAHDPTAMYRLSMVREIRYCEELRLGEGTDYIFRIGEQMPLMVLGECLYQYRIHWNSLTRKDPEQRDRLIQEVFDRMRERQGLPKRQELSRGDDNDLAGHFMMSVADHVLAGRRWGALRVGWQGFWLRPDRPRHLLPLLYALVPRSAVSPYRKLKALLARRRVEAASARRPPEASAP